jgi:molecular chaperone GrpE
MMARDTDRAEPSRARGDAGDAGARGGPRRDQHEAADPAEPASAPVDAAELDSAAAEVASGAQAADLVAERDAAQQQAQEYLALAQRSQADLQNYRKRAEQERTDAHERARADVLLQILPVLDDFELAIAALPPERQDEDWVQGLRLIERKLRSTLESLGVERIVAEGEPFDPWLHEAVLQEAREDIEPGHVATVTRQGYRLGDRVLRPAQVIVAKQP